MEIGHFGLKMACCHNSWIHSKYFFEILHNERGQKYLGQMGYFGTKNGLTSKLWIHYKNFFCNLAEQKG